MIKVTRLNGEIFYLNPHLIERIEAKADTIITMDSQIQYIVKEKFDEIYNKIINYRKKISLDGQE
ncbi:MAG: flagellar FlbD family protein [Candidatus Lokiarchaeota archaeon]|nr:flagellar FlbD family protein [Candidatus Lokiarchaeota archaeon]